MGLEQRACGTRAFAAPPAPTAMLLHNNGGTTGAATPLCPPLPSVLPICCVRAIVGLLRGDLSGRRLRREISTLDGLGGWGVYPRRCTVYNTWAGRAGWFPRTSLVHDPLSPVPEFPFPLRCTTTPPSRLVHVVRLLLTHPILCIVPRLYIHTSRLRLRPFSILDNNLQR